MFKRESGITLVALVITIIILIILAAVSISTVVNNNLFGLATGAANNYIVAGQTESSAISDLVDSVSKIASDLEALQATPLAPLES